MWLLLNDISGFNPACTATYTFEQPISKEKLKAALEKQASKFPRYKQRLTNTGRKFHGAMFEDIKGGWDVYDSVKHVTLPEPAGLKELEDFTATFVAKSWDFSEPLCEVRVLDNYKGNGDSKSAMVIRGHHTLTDGQGFVLSQLLITSYGDELESKVNDGAETLRLARRGKAQPSKVNKALKPLDPYHSSSHLLICLTLQLLMLSLYWIVATKAFVEDFIGIFRMAFNISFYFLLTFWRNKYATAYQSRAGPRVKRREFATTRDLKMDQVKLIQKAFSGVTPGGWRESTGLAGPRRANSIWGHLTLNDILVAVSRSGWMRLSSSLSLTSFLLIFPQFLFSYLKGHRGSSSRRNANC